MIRWDPQPGPPDLRYVVWPICLILLWENVSVSILGNLSELSRENVCLWAFWAICLNYPGKMYVCEHSGQNWCFAMIWIEPSYLQAAIKILVVSVWLACNCWELLAQSISHKALGLSSHTIFFHVLRELSSLYVSNGICLWAAELCSISNISQFISLHECFHLKWVKRLLFWKFKWFGLL